MARYVFHKHAARFFHYDLRLEIDGVFASWAVPKGPSLDPRDKRLAVRVNDHALAYGSFEGTIPEGDYGAGTVMIWDYGTWEPLGDSKSAGEQLTSGRLSFRLHGKKLRGAWTLLKMKPRKGEKGENWLLVKQRDEEARPRDEYDILEALPDSASSGRNMEQIGAEGPVYDPDEYS